MGGITIFKVLMGGITIFKVHQTGLLTFTHVVDVVESLQTCKDAFGI